MSLFDNAWTVWDNIVNFLWEQDTVKRSDEFENGCIPVTCLQKFNVGKV